MSNLPDDVRGTEMTVPAALFVALALLTTGCPSGRTTDCRTAGLNINNGSVLRVRQTASKPRLQCATVDFGPTKGGRIEAEFCGTSVDIQALQPGMHVTVYESPCFVHIERRAKDQHMKVNP